jgi:cobalt-zinc-cadmium efflux system membrane fusion protein
VGVSAVVGAGCESTSATQSAGEDAGASEHGGGHDKKHGGDDEGHGGGHEGHVSSQDEGHGEHDGHDRSRTVELTEKAESRYELKVKQARGGSLVDRVSAPAKVKHSPDRKLHVTPLVKGRVSELHVTVGDRVEEGDPLAVMRSIELGRARAAVERATSDLEVARSNFERVEKLRADGIVSDRRFLEDKSEFESAKADLQAARSELETYGVGGGSGPHYTLTSEIDGRVIEQHVSAGEVKIPSEAMLMVADNSPVWVVGRVYERDIPKVERGMKATVTLASYPSRSWRGEVDWVADTVDEETRNLEVRVELPNEQGTLRPGMFGTVLLEADQTDEVAVVPVGAVQTVQDGRQVVFVPAGEPRHYRATPVETGEEGDGMVEIRSGLQPGDEFVTQGAFDLKATLTASSRSGGHHH